MKKICISLLIAILLIPNSAGFLAYAKETGEKITISNEPNVQMTVKGIPSHITYLKLLIEDKNGNRYLLKEETNGLSTKVVQTYLPSNEYRVRVIGYNGGITFPDVKLGGEIKSLIVTDNGLSLSTVSLEEIEVELHTSTPHEVEVGSKVNIKMEIYDPANFMDRMSQGRIWWNEGKGTKQVFGKITKLEDKKYQFSIEMEAPSQPGQVNYYFSEHNALFKNPEGNEAPFLTTPTYQLIVKEKKPNLNVTISNIPSDLKNVKLLVEGSKGKSYLLREETKGSNTMNVQAYIQPDEYRIRVIGYNGGITYPNVKMGGEIKQLVVAEDGIASEAVSLKEMNISLQTTTPSEAEVGSKVSIKMDIYDPANFLDRASQGRLWWTEDNHQSSTFGKITKIEDYQYQFSIDVNAPLDPKKVTYYFSEHNPLFKNPEGNEAPFITSGTYELQSGNVNSFLKVNEITELDERVTGKSQRASTVYVKIDEEIYQSDIVKESTFAVNIPRQQPGTIIEVYAVNDRGQQSEVKKLLVKDVVAPNQPVVNEVNDQDTILTGRAEAGALVSIKKAAKEIATGQVNENGEFRIRIPMQKAGTELLVTVTDEAGNVSEPRIVIVADVTAPVVTGVSDQGIYNAPVTIHFNEGEATLNGQKINSETEVADDDIYELIVRDEAGNETRLHFEIDQTAPIVTGIEDQEIYNQPVIIEFNEGEATLNGKSIVSGLTVDEEGKYELVVTDKAANTTVMVFEIDRTAPIVTGVKNQGFYNKPVIIEFNEGEAVLNGESIKTGTEVEKEDEYELVVADQAGNMTKVNFVMDRTAPIVTGVEDQGIYNATVTIEFNEGEATLNGESIETGAEVEEEGKYELVVTDKANNMTILSFEMNKTPPVVSGVENEGVYDTVVVIHFDKGEATLNGETFTSGTEVKEAGQYQLIVTDIAGNETIVHFEIKQKESIVISFTDVSESYTFYNEINFLVGRSIISGYPDGSFKPGKSVTRAEAAIMIGRALQLDGTQRNTSFSDVSSSSVASGYIQSAVDAGIISGYPDGTYRPSEAVTRGQLAIFLSRAFKLTETAPVTFVDVPSTSAAYEYVGKLVAANITYGYSDNTFRPNQAVTRGQFSAFLTRAIQYVEQQ